MSTPVRGRSAIVSFAAVLLALSVRMMVPTGWMPDPQGGFRIVPCVAAAPAPKVEHHAEAHGHHQQQQHGGSHEQQQHEESRTDCAFAPLLAGAALPLASDAPQTLPPPRQLRVAAPRRNTALPTGPPAPPPPSTGPPALA